MKRHLIHLSAIALGLFPGSLCMLSRGTCAPVPRVPSAYVYASPVCSVITTPQLSTDADTLILTNLNHDPIVMITHDHVFLTVSGSPQDVTNTLYTVQGQTYAVLNNAPIAIYVDPYSNNVFNTMGQVIGFHQEVNDLSTVPLI